MHFSSSKRPGLLKVLATGALVFLVGTATGLWFDEGFESGGVECSSNHQFINDDFACGQTPVIDKASYTTLKNDLLAYIEEQKKEGNAKEIAIYFRDLEDGPILGIDESAEFSPASLLKLPLSIALMNIAEDEEGFLERQLLYKQIAPTPTQTFIPTVSVEEGKAYSIETLLFNTLVYSDNISYEILLEYLAGLPDGPLKINRVFQELGIIDPRNEVENTLTVRGYASLFRLLYNVSYLNAENSEKILSWLTQSDFDIGLEAGVPKEVPVAHKFGERLIQGTTNIKQLHDCGIVYYPGNPYVICVMTRGNDMYKLSDSIRTISEMVYSEVNSRRLQ